MFRDLPSYTGTKSSAFWQARVPESWQEVPGRAVVKENRNRNADLTEKQVLSLSFGSIVVKPVEMQRGLVPESYEGYQVLKPGDIVIRPTDLQNDQRSIRVGFAKERGIITSAYVGLRATGDWEPEYAYLYLSVVDSSRRIYGMGSGLRQQLGWADIKRMPCLVPPRDEQAAIVKYLAHANARITKAIAAKRRLITLLTEERAVQRASLLDGLGPSQRLAAMLWEGPTNGVSPEISEHGNLQTFSISVVRDGVVDVQRADVKYVDRSRVRDAEKYRLRRGDVLLVRGNGNINLVGRAGLVVDDMDDRIYPDLLMRMRFRSGVVPRFIVAMLNSPSVRQQIENTARTAVGTYKLSGADVRGIRVPVPAPDVQHSVVRQLDEIGRPYMEVVEKLRREISLLQESRTRLVADVVTGQVDVRGVAATLPDTIEVGAGAADEELSALDEELVGAAERDRMTGWATEGSFKMLRSR